MPTISALTSFTANSKIKSAEVNANFSAIRTAVNTYGAFVDASATITGAWTFTTAPTFATGMTVTTGGITVTGNSSVVGTLTATTFSGSGASLTNLPAANLTGTLPAISGANLTNLTAANLTGALPAISGANVTSLNAANISSGTLASARLPATIAANTTGSAQSVVNGSNSIAIGGGTVITIAAGSGSGLTGVNYTVGAFQQGPNGFPTYSAAAAFIPVSIGGTDYFIRCERWTT